MPIKMKDLHWHSYYTQSKHFPGASDMYPDKPVGTASVQLKLKLNTP